MDIGAYPEFDPKAELARAEANVVYHEAQAAYYRNQSDHLRRCVDEQSDRQFIYDEVEPVEPVFDYDPASFIGDASFTVPVILEVATPPERVEEYSPSM